mmetsp:Transcript_4085/g.12279  ORF Transcript_4085/g.12279 Transcript_4085/m.12279 type:complete len:265 (+) Transcript_4085:225-1019(+)
MCMAPSKYVALVTGATRGLGLAIAKELAWRGHHVLLTGRDVAKGSAEAEALQREGWNAKFFPLDVCKIEDIERLAVIVREQYCELLRVVVNNAAVCPDGWNPTDVQSALDTNVFAVMNLVGHLAPHMPQDSCFLNISSGDGESVWFSNSLRESIEAADTADLLAEWLHSLVGAAGSTLPTSVVHGEQPAYKLSKYALNRYTRVVYPILRSDNIRINCVCPGDVKTRMNPTALHDPHDAARRMLWLLDPCGPSGGFFRHDQELPW